MKSLLDLGQLFLHEEDGQDSVEYALLLGFIVLSAAAIFPVVTSGIETIWHAVGNRLFQSTGADR